mgnify:CR=1 FL=1
MQSQFTDKAKTALLLAGRAAKSLHQNYVGTEHILLGLIKEGTGVASRVLTENGAKEETIREMIQDLLAPETPNPVIERDGYSPRAEEVLEESHRQAEKAGSVLTGTEHILLALLGDGDNVAVRVLQTLSLPLQKINPENWLDVTQEYRRLFALEIQFRRFYVDYFLKVLGQQKTFYAECECYQQGRRTGFADNAIKIGGKWCFVEVKLNVHAEPHLHDQLKKYCHAERVILQKGERTLPQEKVWQNTILVIDTEDFYIYSVSSDQLTLLESLDKIKTESNIKALQKRILPLLN